ncbi:MAG: DUF2061 domain-containing protein [Maritimibacter harenae]|jgi:uncharacterized membrane protein|uniref:DUF2061 domain-containing protein n=1 Tax=Maritimibacter harenae TaxID=2606218 RepID=A0A845M2S8_9RHOB|nr:DUF2061 domain-containing protein [Maritimibacter harenae]MZR14650.1 DUF2061 domain-containing protein [Maritimibacter harenae]
MDTTKRTLAKAISWQVMGLFVTTALGYVATGSVTAGGALAVSSAGLGLVTYTFHEKIWARIRWGYNAVRAESDAT